ncbi:TetR/AcrR family transcriptional regulator [Streptomyces sp. NPDC005728]|uniref:TetR/AcrR family transcriptional regulator n=1 Tax=Streptomyces sp. NPDC005728 TaxID=3157054 RepID=UPI0033F2A34D
MASAYMPEPPGRSRTRPTRARILEAARQELGRDPDSSLGDIAEAAGVVRRTVYGHFNGRAALVEGLVEDAAQALRQALAVRGAPESDVVTELVRFVLAVWPVGDRYRMLLRLAPRISGPSGSPRSWPPRARRRRRSSTPVSGRESSRPAFRPAR